MSDNQMLVGLNIGASLKWRTKRWPLENIAKLCNRYAQKGIRVLLTGSKDDCDDAQVLLSMVKGKPINMVGRTTLMELACLIKKCKLFITADSAPLHIASSVSTPTIALFGPTDPHRHLQPSESVVLVHKSEKCAPCYKKSCNDIRCMSNITAEEVFEASLTMLGIDKT